MKLSICLILSVCSSLLLAQQDDFEDSPLTPSAPAQIREPVHIAVRCASRQAEMVWHYNPAHGLIKFHVEQTDSSVAYTFRPYWPVPDEPIERPRLDFDFSDRNSVVLIFKYLSDSASYRLCRTDELWLIDTLEQAGFVELTCLEQVE